MPQRDISLVIPVYNEQDSIKPLIAELGEVLNGLDKSYEIIFVDDGSRDRSFALLKEAAAHDPRIRAIRFRKNAGQTAAFDAGFRTAQGDIVVTMDADLQNDPRDIPRLLEKIERFDVVCGWRHKRRDPWIKIVSSQIANAVRNTLSQEEIADTGCSLKAFRRESLHDMKLFNGMHRFLPTLAKMEGFTVTQVKVNHRPRRFGRTKYNIRNRMVRAFADLLAVRWMKKRHLTYEIKETIR
ncbi:MAG: glycosyl transferase [Deltaproteobacteria bacterium RBG_16_54_11]|jgi:glycosyltransferase involved in cell wall biosynthesis|nr:MAG: glycosyl transferase [Deltaproteobacteria bacterium RBG_16_54_11]